jgi:hypothetical protein
LLKWDYRAFYFVSTFERMFFERRNSSNALFVPFRLELIRPAA